MYMQTVLSLPGLSRLIHSFNQAIVISILLHKQSAELGWLFFTFVT